ncbi:hypothetical protein METH109765_08970 [Mesobacillus thioparans]
MNLNFLQLLAIFTTFYLIRFFFDTKYKEKKKSYILLDIIITTILAFGVQLLISLLFN